MFLFHEFSQKLWIFERFLIYKVVFLSCHIIDWSDIAKLAFKKKSQLMIIFFQIVFLQCWLRLRHLLLSEFNGNILTLPNSCIKFPDSCRSQWFPLHEQLNLFVDFNWSLKGFKSLKTKVLRYIDFFNRKFQYYSVSTC